MKYPYDDEQQIKEQQDILDAQIMNDTPPSMVRDPFEAPMMQTEALPIKRVEPALQTPQPVDESELKQIDASTLQIPEPVVPYSQSNAYKQILSKLDQLGPKDNSEELKQAQQDRQSGLRNALIMQGASQINKALGEQYGGKVVDNQPFIEAYRNKVEQTFKDEQDKFKLQAEQKKQERAQLLSKLDLLKEEYDAGRIARNDKIQAEKMIRDEMRQVRQEESRAKEEQLQNKLLKNKLMDSDLDLQKKMDENDPKSAISTFARMQAKQSAENSKKLLQKLGYSEEAAENIEIPEKASAAQLKDMGLYRGQGSADLMAAARLASLAQTEKRLDIQEKAEERKRSGQEFNQQQKNELSDKQVKDIATQDTAISFVNDIRNYKQQNKIETGQIADKKNLAAQKLNLDDPKVSTFRAMVGQQLADYIKSISGAAVSDQERAVLTKLIPNMEDSNATFNSKLDQLQSKLQKIRKTELDLVGKAQGKDISKFESPSETLVTIQGPSGQTVQMKRENAEKYLSRPGYKLIK